MEVDIYISTSSAAIAKNQLTINNLDDDSLGIIFNKLAYIDRMRIESVCQRWYTVSEANWGTYSKRLTIGKYFLPLDDNTTENESILHKFLERVGPYLEEITFHRDYYFCKRFEKSTIKQIIELCPKLKRLNTGSLILNADDWLACSNLEALSFCSIGKLQGNDLGVLFRSNKRLRQLGMYSYWLSASDFYHLDPGQLEFLLIEYCKYFEFTAEVADKLAESLVHLTYSLFRGSTLNLQHFSKLKNLRFLELKVGMKGLDTKFIADIAENCQKLECLFLCIGVKNAYDSNFLEPLFHMPYLKKLVIIVRRNNMPRENERNKLLKKASHFEFFVIDECFKCMSGSSFFGFCYRHRWSWLSLSSYKIAA